MDKHIIRNWSKSDIPALAKYLNNKKIWDNCRDSLPCPYTRGRGPIHRIYQMSEWTA